MKDFAPISQNKTAIHLFYSYSHKDEKLREKLEEHLSILKRRGIITSWQDRQISPGTEWKGEINRHLEKAQIILLLISASFISSDYIWDVEMKRALERHEKGDARVIPVILRPADWYTAPFSKLQALPRNGKPIITWSNIDDAFTDVAIGIRKVVEELTSFPNV